MFLGKASTIQFHYRHPNNISHQILSQSRSFTKVWLWTKAIEWWLPHSSRFWKGLHSCTHFPFLAIRIHRRNRTDRECWSNSLECLVQTWSKSPCPWCLQTCSLKIGANVWDFLESFEWKLQSFYDDLFYHQEWRCKRCENRADHRSILSHLYSLPIHHHNSEKIVSRNFSSFSKLSQFLEGILSRNQGTEGSF